MNTTEKLADALRLAYEALSGSTDKTLLPRAHRAVESALAQFDSERQQAAGAAQPQDGREASNPYAHSKNHASVWEAGYDAGRRAAIQQPAPEAPKGVPNGMVRCPRCWEVVTAPVAPAPEAQQADRERQLGNMLALIHRDGGHYITEHGWNKAIADAEAKVIAWLQQPAQAVPLSDEAAFQLASEYFNSAWYSRVAVGVVRATERACAEAWGVKLAGIGTAKTEGGA